MPSKLTPPQSAWSSTDEAHRQLYYGGERVLYTVADRGGSLMAHRANQTSYKAGHTGIKGANNKKWKGDDASYFAIHIWLKTNYGKALRCEHCTIPSRRYEWANIRGVYTHDRSEFMQLCTSCHQRYDKARIYGENKCHRGHDFTPENTYVYPDGRRRYCRTCYANSPSRSKK